ncbi:MAG: S8 family serine peptidase, partial [Gemmatimonadota bacterium]|nr:S8 family serine peptidase [Gemmatimonadota bacterium]
MWLMAGVVAGLCGGGCTDEDPTGPQRLAAPAAQVLVTADTACVRARFDLTGPTTVQTQFPERTDCATSLVLIRAQPAQWAQSPNRQLRVFVRILNTSGAAIQLPVRLYLSPTGTTVDVPSGTPGSKVVPLNADSTDAGGGKIWFLGGTSVLAVGDSTALDTLGFNVQSPVDQARWQFQATAMSSDTAPPTLPENWVPSQDSANTIAIDVARKVVVRRDVFTVEFSIAATGTQIQALLSKYQATVIGGLPEFGPRGTYVIQIPDPGPTLGAVDSVVIALRGEPGVFTADRIYYRNVLRPRARFPIDGALVAGRAAWSDTGRTTLAWRAIRATQAWGCETGLYGGSGPHIGILDLTLDSLPDLPVLRRVAPRSGMVLDTAFLAHSGIIGSASRSHGLAVSGIMTAVGDNSRGIAGLVWGSTGVFYGLGFRDSVSAAPGRVLRRQVLPDLQASGVRLLVTSAAFGVASDSAGVADYRAFLEQWLQSSPNNLFVYPMDEDSSRASLTTVASTPDSNRAASDRAVAQVALVRPDQIILVAGSRPGARAFWGRSGFWNGAGGTAIAAPAESVLTLAHVPDFGTDSRLAAGTSYAAPMVAGVAAQLMTMDSTLTAAQVKDYILRGAQEPLLDSLTGQPVQRQPVSGAPGTVYQLDAYGSLSLLSRERPGTPICGSD